MTVAPSPPPAGREDEGLGGCRGSRGDWPPADLVRSIRGELGARGSDLGLVLGSGLGGLASLLEDPWVRAGAEMPGYPQSTVPGHSGRLLLGRLAGREVWVVQGRVHLYEGYSAEEVSRYVGLLHALGLRTLILTNAAGAVDRRVGPGDVVAASDAISLFFRPLALRARGELVSWRRRPALVDPNLLLLAQEVAREEGIPLATGVLVGSSGPAYETAAEVRTWRRLGGTVASMSTVPEACSARELGVRCLLFSLVTNYATGLGSEALRHEDVVRGAETAGASLGRLLTALLPRI